MNVPISLQYADIQKSLVHNMILAPTGHLGISREQMPQIEGQYKDKFIAYIKGCGIPVRNVKVPTKSLKLIQGEYNRDKVVALMRQELSNKPIYISLDGYVIDGNHRLIAQYNTPGADYIDVVELGMNAKEVLEVIHDFPNVRYRTAHGELK